MAILQIPSLLQAHTNNQAKLLISGSTVKEVLINLLTKYEGLKPYIFSSTDQLNNFINIYVNSADIRFLQKLDTVVKENDVLILLPATAGG